MKVVAVVLTLVAVVKANAIHPAPVAVAAPANLIETGSSRVARTEDNLGNYAFGYDEIHTTGGSFRREQATNGGVTGSYGLRDADGRIRTVNYIADAAGFRVAITSNEPGVLPKDSAGALVNNGEVPPGPVHDETATLVAAPAAPILAQAPLHAPIAAAHLAAPAHLTAAPAHLAAPVQLAAPAHLAAPGHLVAGPTHFAAPAHLAAAPAHLAAPTHFAPLPASVNGPLITRAAVPSAPVLASPTGQGVPTVLSNPLINGPFQTLARPAISTPHALTTAPLASPLTPGLASPLAAPALAGHQQFLAPAPITHGHFAAPVQQLVHQAPLTQVAAPVHLAAAPAHLAAPAGYGYQYQTQIQHLAAPALVAQAPVAGVKGY